MTRIICFVNRKGGSGKTTTTFNLAGALAEQGRRVLVIDLDPQGSFSRSLGINGDGPKLSAVLMAPSEEFAGLVQPTSVENLFLLPADPDLKIIELRYGELAGHHNRLRSCLTKFLPEGFDFILIDCPPSLSILTSNALVAAHEVIIPVDGSTYGTEALKDTLESIKLVQEEVNPDLRICGILLGNINRRTIYDQTIEETYRNRFTDTMFDTVISTSIKADEAAMLGKPITNYASSSYLAQCYRQLAEEVASRSHKKWSTRKKSSGLAKKLSSIVARR